MNDVLPDALAGVLGKVVADARREWVKASDLMAAEARATIAELRAENLQLRGEMQGLVNSEIVRLREAAAALKNGRDGIDGQPGDKGEQGPAGPAPDYGIVLERSEPLLKNLIEARWDEWTATLPLPERGEKGEPGKDADPADIERAVGDLAPPLFDLIPRAVADEVQRAVAALPLAERGERGLPGEQGERGLDGERGKPGAPGERGTDGRGIAELVLDDAGALVARYTDGAEASLGIVRGRDGADGRDGIDGGSGEKGEPGPIGERGLQGECGTDGADGAPGEKGQKGDPGPQGEKGLQGEAGRDGVGMAGSLIDRDGQLVTTMSDGSVRSLGVVVGRDGAQGPPGKDGLDGVGFDDLEVIDAEREAKIRFVRGDNVKEYPVRKAGFWDRGVYKPGETYLRGDSSLVRWVAMDRAMRHRREAWQRWRGVAARREAWSRWA